MRMDNLYHALKPGGYLVFAEEFASKAGSASHKCHPLRVTEDFFREFLELNFETVFLDADLKEWRKMVPGALEGSMRSVYSIAKKPNKLPSKVPNKVAS